MRWPYVDPEIERGRKRSWFAWYPVRLWDDKSKNFGDWVWWEWVEVCSWKNMMWGGRDYRYTPLQKEESDVGNG